MQQRVLFGVTQKKRHLRPLPFFLRIASIMARWVDVRVVGVRLLPRVPISFGCHQTDRRVVSAAGFLVVVLLDRLLFRFSVFRHLNRFPTLRSLIISLCGVIAYNSSSAPYVCAITSHIPPTPFPLTPDKHSRSPSSIYPLSFFIKEFALLLNPDC